MHALRFLTVFAAAIAAWMVLMWFALDAVGASEDGARPRIRVPAAPASSVDEPALPIAAAALGARGLLDACRHPAWQGGAA